MRISPVLLLTATIGTVGANSLVLSPIAGAVAKNLDVASAQDVMIASAVYGLAVAGSALFLAPRSDKIGADKALLQALVLLSIAFVASAMSPNLIGLSLAQGVAGIGAGMALPAIYGLAAHIAPKGKESQVMGKVIVGWTLSMAGGVTLSTYLTEFAGWRAVYWVLAVFTVISALLIHRLQLATPTHKGRATSPLTALKTPGLLPALFVVAVLGSGFYGIYNFIGAHLEQALGRPVKDAGLLTLCYGAGFGLAVFFDPVLDRIGPRRGLAGVFLVLGVFYTVMSHGIHSYRLLLGLMFVWGAVQHLGLNLTVSRLNALDATQRGAIMGLNSMVMYLSVFFATVLFRPIYDGYGLYACALTAAVLAVFGAAEALWPRPQTQTQSQSQARGFKSGRSCAPSEPTSVPASPSL